MRQIAVVTALLVLVAIPVAFFADGGSTVRSIVSAAKQFTTHGVSLARATRTGATERVAALTNGTADTGVSATEWLRQHERRPSVPTVADNPFEHMEGGASGAPTSGVAAIPSVTVRSPTDQPDFAAAAARYALGAKPDDPDAHYAIAINYRDGNGVPQNFATAAHWLREAAELGHPRAALELAAMYVEGNGVEQNYPKAFLWYDRAAQGMPAEADRAEAATRRDRVARAMTSDELAQATTLVRDWKPIPAVPDPIPLPGVDPTVVAGTQ